MHDLTLFAHLLYRVLLLTGLGPGIAIAILWERRIRGFGFEQVPQPVRCRQLAMHNGRMPTSSCRATSLHRKVRRVA
jgi:hypothetical protein